MTSKKELQHEIDELKSEIDEIHKLKREIRLRKRYEEIEKEDKIYWRNEHNELLLAVNGLIELVPEVKEYVTEDDYCHMILDSSKISKALKAIEVYNMFWQGEELSNG